MDALSAAKPASCFAHPVPLGELELLPLPGIGPEDVLLDPDGRILTGLSDGSIVRIDRSGAPPETLANTGGRPLGLDWLPDGRLLVCDCQRGLLAIDLTSSKVEVLLRSVAGKDMRICNNPAVASDGTIYFSDSSTRYPLEQIRADIVERVPTGRLLCRKPSGSVEVLVEPLYFANGVVLSADESFVLVAETGAARVRRYWLKGPRRGRLETFADGLPGLPDNMCLGSDGLFWIALPTASDPRLSAVHRLPRLLRSQVKRIPEPLQPRETRRALFVALDADGNGRHFFEADPRRYHLVTGLRERDGVLYAGSIEASSIAVLRLPPPRASDPRAELARPRTSGR
jgi:sugar lactone lactonase YvrE